MGVPPTSALGHQWFQGALKLPWATSGGRFTPCSPYSKLQVTVDSNPSHFKTHHTHTEAILDILCPQDITNSSWWNPHSVFHERRCAPSYLHREGCFSPAELSSYSAAVQFIRLFVKVVVGARELLLPVLDGLQLVDARPVVGGIAAEGDVQLLRQESVTTRMQDKGRHWNDTK